MANIALPNQALLSLSTSTGPGSWYSVQRAPVTFQGVLNASSTCGAVIEIEVSNDGVNAIDTPLGTITLNATSSTPVSDGFASAAKWGYVRANIQSFTSSTNLTGVSVTMGG